MPPEQPIKFVLDANVLFPIRLCDTLLRAADIGLYLPLWTDRILDEVERNLVAQQRTTEERARRRRMAMEARFPTAVVTGYEGYIPAMPNHPNDRHVLAAAVHADARVIVTRNLRHFPPPLIAPLRVTAQSADTFLMTLFNASPETMVEIVREQAAALTRPPLSVAQVLTRLAVETPAFVAAIARRMRGEESP